MHIPKLPQFTAETSLSKKSSVYAMSFGYSKNKSIILPQDIPCGGGWCHFEWWQWVADPVGTGIRCGACKAACGKSWDCG